MISVKSDKNDIIVRFPQEYISNKIFEKFLERLNLEELSQQNYTTEKQSEEISEEINNSWWNRYKKEFLSGIKQ